MWNKSILSKKSKDCLRSNPRLMIAQCTTTICHYLIANGLSSWGCPNTISTSRPHLWNSIGVWMGQALILVNPRLLQYNFSNWIAGQASQQASCKSSRNGFLSPQKPQLIINLKSSISTVESGNLFQLETIWLLNASS